jgi:hypothetical protein
MFHADDTSLGPGGGGASDGGEPPPVKLMPGICGLFGGYCCAVTDATDKAVNSMTMSRKKFCLLQIVMQALFSTGYICTFRDLDRHTVS